MTEGQKPFILLYTADTANGEKRVKSEHYAKNIKTGCPHEGFYLTNQEKRSSLYQYLTLGMETFPGDRIHESAVLTMLQSMKAKRLALKEYSNSGSYCRF